MGNLSIVVNVRLLIISADSFIARDTSRKVRDHYVVDVSCSGDSGLMLANTNYYDGIIIDNGLTDISGLEICGTIREDGIASPILMLLEKECACKRGLYLDTGADMCLIKPVEQLLLLSKLRAIARKTATIFVVVVSRSAIFILIFRTRSYCVMILKSLSAAKSTICSNI